VNDDEDTIIDAVFDAVEESQRRRGIIPIHNADDIDAATAVLRSYLAEPRARIHAALTVLDEAILITEWEQTSHPPTKSMS
jgi:hypothetical protein